MNSEWATKEAEAWYSSDDVGGPFGYERRVASLAALLDRVRREGREGTRKAARLLLNLHDAGKALNEELGKELMVDSGNFQRFEDSLEAILEFFHEIDESWQEDE
jgi:hypothetical protein